MCTERLCEGRAMARQVFRGGDGVTEKRGEWAEVLFRRFRGAFITLTWSLRPCGKEGGYLAKYVRRHALWDL